MGKQKLVIIFMALMASNAHASFFKKLVAYARHLPSLRSRSIMIGTSLATGWFSGENRRDSHQTNVTNKLETTLTDTIVNLCFQNNYIKSMWIRGGLDECLSRGEEVSSGVFLPNIGVIGTFNLTTKLTPGKPKIVIIRSELAGVDLSASPKNDAFTQCKKKLMADKQKWYCTTRLPADELK